MSIFNDKALKGVAEAVSKIVEAEKMAKKDHDQDGKIETGKAEYLGSRIRAAKLAGKLKEEEKIDEAFPTVADAKKRMDAGKTATGTVTKTKTGLVHKRDYEHDAGDDDHPEKKGRPSSYGARQNMGKRGQSDGTKKTMKEEKLSFTEMLHLYNESGVEVISKIVPQTVKFGDTEVELIDANIVNGAVAVQVEEGVMSAVKGAVGVVKDVISKEKAYQAQKQISTGNTLKKLRKEESLSEEPDNETFTKEVEAQKEKNAGRGKKAEVAKASVQAVKQEEVEQIDEVSKKTLGSYIKAASHDVAAKGAFTRHFADKSRAETAAQRPDLARLTMKKADKMQDAGMKRRANMAKAVDRLTKEDVEQIDERTLTSGETAKKEDYVKGMKKSVSGFKARYGDKAKSVMYATATKMAKKD
jgi:hypothetical protein